jgi:D-lyxose ketol-isomerase
VRRSEINACIRRASAFFASHRFALPPFAEWSPAHWNSIGPEADGIRRGALGWDDTDLGRGDFEACGLILFTLRNGIAADPDRCYAEKIMMVGEGQVTPWHFHWVKTEDIINRGGGNLVVEVGWASKDEASIVAGDVEIECDGVVRAVRKGEALVLRPGESVTLPPRLYHQFCGEPGGGPVLVGEVSRVNDDARDNRFLEELGRFPEIDEDEAPWRLLCHEYPETRP